jgi:hypothetical protein
VLADVGVSDEDIDGVVDTEGGISRALGRGRLDLLEGLGLGDADVERSLDIWWWV